MKAALALSPINSFDFWCAFFLGGGTPEAYGSSQARVESGLQLPVHTTTTATQDLSHVCDLHHSLLQCQILNPLSEARD